VSCSCLYPCLIAASVIVVVPDRASAGTLGTHSRGLWQREDESERQQQSLHQAAAGAATLRSRRDAATSASPLPHFRCCVVSLLPQMAFDAQGAVGTWTTRTFQLEKSRVTSHVRGTCRETYLARSNLDCGVRCALLVQLMGDRSFHVLYYLVCGADDTVWYSCTLPTQRVPARDCGRACVSTTLSCAGVWG
jgi:hypothetical protein